MTPASGRSAISSGQRTEPGSHTRERSLRSRSTIIVCSAASFSDSRRSSSPSGRVPLIGIVRSVRPRRWRKSSGDAETTAQPSPTSGSGWSGRSGASRAARPAGSPRNGAERCWTTFTWYTSPRAIASRTASTAAPCSAPTSSAPSRRARTTLGWLRSRRAGSGRPRTGGGRARAAPGWPNGAAPPSSGTRGRGRRARPPRGRRRSRGPRASPRRRRTDARRPRPRARPYASAARLVTQCHEPLRRVRRWRARPSCTLQRSPTGPPRRAHRAGTTLAVGCRS